MKRYLATCPHTKVIKREKGDFVTEGKKSYFRVDEVITEIVPCGEKNYIVINEMPFSQKSGIDPIGIEVNCKGCGRNYFLFPMKKKEGEEK